MSNSDSNASSGSDKMAAGGASAESTKTEENKKETVAYDTHVRLLAEKKKVAQDFAEAQAKLKALEEKELRDKENYKALVELREKELAEEKNRRANLEATVNNSIKLDSVLKNLSGKVDQKFFGMFNLDKVPLDPNTNMPDQLAVERYAREFEETYPELIQKQTNVQMPNNAAKGTNARITYEEWLKLPLKDQKARLKDVMQS